MARLILDHNHPAYFQLANEGVGFYSQEAAKAKDALKIGVINLMPDPTHPIHDFGILFARHAQQDIQLLDFSPTPDKIRNDRRAIARRKMMIHIDELVYAKPDAIILTGYGKEDIAFEDLKFWSEITGALDYAKINGTPVLASCWGSHAALYHHHNVQRYYAAEDKISGIFSLNVEDSQHPIMTGIPDVIDAPVSRYGRSDDDTIRENSEITVLASSDDTGIAIATDERVLYLTGHPEYADEAIADEYRRDLKAETPHLKVPLNVFINNDPDQNLLPNSWKDASGQLIRNWVNVVDAFKKDNIEHMIRTPSGCFGGAPHLTRVQPKF